MTVRVSMSFGSLAMRIVVLCTIRPARPDPDKLPDVKPSDLQLRAATAADRASAVRMLAAQLSEHGLPVDMDGIERALELCLAQSSTAWLVMAFLGGLPVGVLLANPIVSVEQGGASLWVE